MLTQWIWNKLGTKNNGLIIIEFMILLFCEISLIVNLKINNTYVFSASRWPMVISILEQQCVGHFHANIFCWCYGMKWYLKLRVAF